VGILAVTGDPVGDGFGNMVHDIDQFSISTDGVELTVRIDFVNPISLPGSGQPDEVFGFIDFDTDQNAGTGILSNPSVFCPGPSGLGQHPDRSGASRPARR
jgi:hypothetical protein